MKRSFLWMTLVLFLIACKKENTCDAELGKAFTVDYNKTVCFKDENLEISFEALVTESRCPPNAMCIWSGYAAIQLNVRSKNKNNEVVLQTLKYGAYSETVYVDGYTIVLKNLSYYPPSLKDYKAELLVTK